MPPVAGAALVAAAGAALSGTAVGVAGGLTLAAAISAVSVGSIVAAGVVGAAGAGLQLALAKKPKTTPPNASIRQATPVFLPDIYGDCRVGASAAFWKESSNEKNRDLVTAWVISAHRLEEITEVWDGDRRMWSASGGLEADYAERLVVSTRLGTSGQDTPADMLTAAAGVVDSNFRLAGRGWCYIRFLRIAKFWPDGIPQSLWFRVKGKRVFDPRSGLTAYSANWALCFRDYLIARGGIPAARFLDSEIAAAANLCDEAVSVTGGGTVPRYEINGAFRSEVSARDAIEEWKRQGGNLRGGLVNAGDRLVIRPGAYSAPVAAFAEDDFLAPVKVTGETLVEERFEGVRGTFRPKRASSRFQPEQFKTVLFDDYAGAPEDAILLELDFDRETRFERASRLALLALRQTRRFRKVATAVPFSALNAALLPGDRVTLALAAIGLSGAFEIVEAKTVFDPAGPRVEIVALEDDPDFWGWTAATASEPPEGLDSTLPDPFNVAPPVDVTVTAQRRVETDGTVTRWLAVEWEEPAGSLLYFDRYEIEWTQGGKTLSARTTLREFDIFGLSAASGASVLVYAVNTLGIRSAGIGPAGGAVTPGGDITPPGPPPSGAIFPVAGGFRFLIGNPTDSDLAGLRLYEGASGAAFGATVAVQDVAATPGGSDTPILRQGVAPNTTRRFFVAAYDRSGNLSAPFGPLEATTPTALTTEEIDTLISDVVARVDDVETDVAAAIASASANGASITTLQTESTALAASFAAGQTVNALRNSDFTLGTEGPFEADYWHLNGGNAGYQWGRRALNSIFSGPTDLDRPLFVRRIAGEADISADLIATLQRKGPAASTEWGVPVQAGRWIEVSANVGATNCEARLGLQFRDASNVVLENNYSGTVSAAVSGDPAANERLWIKREAPAGAVRAVFFVNMLASVSGASDAFAVVFRPQICESDAASTDPRPYAPGSSATVGSVDSYFRRDVGVLAADGLAIAQAVDSQGSRLDTAEASITTINTTKVDAGGAIAAVSSTLNAGSDGNIASVAALATAFSDGATGAFDILTVTAGGSVARRTLAATENGSLIVFDANQIRFRADLFQVANGDGANAKSVFEVSGGQVVIDGDFVLKGESVGTGRIAPEATSKGKVANGLFASVGGGVVRQLTTISLPRAGRIIADVRVLQATRAGSVGSFVLRIGGAGGFASGSGAFLGTKTDFGLIGFRDVAAGTHAVEFLFNNSMSNIEWEAIVSAYYA